MFRPVVWVFRFTLLVSLAILTINMIACGSSAASTGGVGGGGNVPVIVSFTANQTTITAGALAIISWDVTNATTVTISPNVGEDAPELKGSANVSPPQTTTYTLTATGAGGTSSKALTITV